MSYTFRFKVVEDALPDLLAGTGVTLALGVSTMLIGVLLAFPLALSCRREGVSKRIAECWIETARNTPCLFQIYAFYFGLGALGIFLDAWVAVGLALLFNNAGYTAEILRGGLEAVNPNQLRAARSLGMPEHAAYLWVVAPQVFRISYFALTNQLVWSILNSSLGSVIGLNDLSGTAMLYQSMTFRTFEFFIVVGVIYAVIIKVLLLIMRAYSYKLFKY